MTTATWALATLLALVVVLTGVVPVLMARYDGAALRVQPPATAWPTPSPAAHTAAWQALQAWCFAGTAPGSRPFWRPWAPPRMAQRFAVAQLAGAPGAPQQALAEAFSRHIDGSDQLAALHSRAAGIALRLRVKLHDAMWWRARQPADPWDSGYLVDEAAALQALRAFRPRRATLLVASGLPADALQARIHLLRERSGGFAHPVRLLVVGASEALPGGGPLAVTRLPLA